MGVDLKKVDFPLPENAKTIVQNAFQLPTNSMPTLDVVVSDMAPKTMGDFRADSGRSARFVELTMQLADTKLAVGGSMLAKMFDGAETKTLLKQLKLRYEVGRIMRPQATRSQSNEIYLVGVGKRSNNVELPSKWRVADKRSPPPQQPQNFNGW
jgi:23S rRNA (uridine2552-2'-O)-methyltransferase